VFGNVFLNRNQIEKIEDFLNRKEFTIYCDYNASTEEKSLAKEISNRLGIGLSWTEVDGELLAIGNPETNNLVRDIGLLKNSIDKEWPGKNKGAIIYYENFEKTQKPLLLIGGSNSKGTIVALKRFIKNFIKDKKPPKGFDFWVAGTDLKVFPYTRPYGNKKKDIIQLSAAKGEYESAQCVITAYEELKNIEIEISPLVNSKTGKEIKKRYSTSYRKKNGPIWVRWVYYFPIENSPARLKGWTGVPDPLLERPVRNIGKGASQPIWLTIIVPEGAEPGLYKSKIICKANNEEKSIPIELTVWDFEIPKDITPGGEPYMSLQNISPDGRRTLQKKDIERLIRNFVEHGMRKIHLGPEGMFRWHFSPEGKFLGIDFEWMEVSEDGKVCMDASYFDWLVETIDNSAKPFKVDYMLYIQNVLSNGYGQNTGYFDFKKALPNRFKGKPKRKGHFYNSYYVEEMLTLLRKHLEKKEWIDRFVLKIGDEPRGFNWWWENLTVAARNAGIPITTAFNNLDWKEAEKGLGKVKDWCPLYMIYNKEFFKKAKQAGDKISWYNCGPPPRISTGATASELRSYLWQAAKADLDYVVWWGIQCWRYYSHPQVWTDRYSHWNSVVYPEMPGKPAWIKKGKGWVDTAPIDSIRWELIREGMEDAWYVNILRNLIFESRKRRFKTEAKEAEAVLQNIWEEIFPSLNNYNPEYKKILEARKKIAMEILKLKKLLKE